MLFIMLWYRWVLATNSHIRAGLWHEAPSTTFLLCRWQPQVHSRSPFGETSCSPSLRFSEGFSPNVWSRSVLLTRRISQISLNRVSTCKWPKKKGNLQLSRAVQTYTTQNLLFWRTSYLITSVYFINIQVSEHVWGIIFILQIGNRDIYWDKAQKGEATCLRSHQGFWQRHDLSRSSEL